MNESVIEDAVRKAKDDEHLLSSLKDWHAHKGELCSEDRDKSFDDWILSQVLYSSTLIDSEYCGSQNSDDIVEVLRIDAIGDVLAIRLGNEAEKEGFATDINCCVEDSRVDSNVWIHSDDEDKSYEKAKAIAERFRENGYSAEIWVDEEEANDVTVNAVLDFKSYVKNILGGSII